MPIRPENRHRYGPDWKEFSRRIRFDRAGGVCECEGECGMPGHAERPGRCVNEHGGPSVYTGSKVVLTVAHLNHVPEERGDDQVKAMCQGCHLWYDRDHHAATRAAKQPNRHGFKVGDHVFVGPNGLKLWQIASWEGVDTQWGDSAHLEVVFPDPGRQTWSAFSDRLVRPHE